jgi:hypothetical protein
MQHFSSDDEGFPNPPPNQPSPSDLTSLTHCSDDDSSSTTSSSSSDNEETDKQNREESTAKNFLDEHGGLR